MAFPPPVPSPPTPAQLNSLCAEAAAIARSWTWQEGDISLQSVMTHADAATNRDGRVMYDNYWPMISLVSVNAGTCCSSRRTAPVMAASSCASVPHHA